MWPDRPFKTVAALCEHRTSCGFGVNSAVIDRRYSRKGLLTRHRNEMLSHGQCHCAFRLRLDAGATSWLQSARLGGRVLSLDR